MAGGASAFSIATIVQTVTVSGTSYPGALRDMPNIVLLFIGTNDEGYASSEAGATDWLATLIYEIAAALPNVLLVVSSIYPFAGCIPLTGALSTDNVHPNDTFRLSVDGLQLVRSCQVVSALNVPPPKWPCVRVPECGLVWRKQVTLSLLPICVTLGIDAGQPECPVDLQKLEKRRSIR